MTSARRHAGTKYALLRLSPDGGGDAWTVCLFAKVSIECVDGHQTTDGCDEHWLGGREHTVTIGWSDWSGGMCIDWVVRRNNEYWGGGLRIGFVDWVPGWEWGKTNSWDGWDEPWLGKVERPFRWFPVGWYLNAHGGIGTSTKTKTK